MANTLKFLSIHKINSMVILPFPIVYLFSCLYRCNNNSNDNKAHQCFNESIWIPSILEHAPDLTPASAQGKAAGLVILTLHPALHFNTMPPSYQGETFAFCFFVIGDYAYKFNYL